eukprot:TRINITY_DN104117_c0_g1_i1.p1 TRINITY_DN104117_c0_g1~~TRINITY_DN104117_c0_g1_i1.p1  ORF type:complete len:303 (+),score=11.16 TRINITY_DN104117_c0_g1_i1:73-981(+)
MKDLSVFVDSAAGAAAGLFSSTCTHPLDVLKARFQAEDARSSGLPRSTVRALAAIYRHEGLRGMYAGFIPAVVGNVVAWGVYFGAFRWLQHHWALHLVPEASRDFLAGSLAGAVGSLCTNPIWVVKLRMQLQQKHGRQCGAQYRGLLHGMYRLTLEEGIAGLYKGFVPQLLLTTQGGIQMCLYGVTKRFFANRKQMDIDGGKEILAPWELFVCTLVSKTASSTITNPIVVLRTRIQDHRNTVHTTEVHYSRLYDFKLIWQREGIRGFFRGLVPNLLRVMPSTVIIFMTYEHLRYWGHLMLRN